MIASGKGSGAASIVPCGVYGLCKASARSSVR